MVGHTSAKSCDGRGHSIGSKRIDRKSHTVQTASGDRRYMHQPVAIGGAPSGVNSSEQCSACPSIEKGCGAGALDSGTLSSTRSPLHEGRLAVSGASQRHCSGLAASAHDIPSLRTAVGRKTVYKVLRSPSELPKGKLRDTSACSKAAEQLPAGCSRHGGHRFNVHVEKLEGERRFSGSCCKVQKSLVNRSSRHRPLVRAVSANGAEFAAEHEEALHSHLQAQGRIEDSMRGPASEQDIGMVQQFISKHTQDRYTTPDRRATLPSTHSDTAQFLRGHCSDFCVDPHIHAEGATAKIAGRPPVRTPSSHEGGRSLCNCAQCSESCQDRDRTCTEGSGTTSLCASVSGCSSRRMPGFDSSSSFYHKQQQRFTASGLPSRETLVRRLLPALPEKSAALRMKSTIESLYDDSVSAIESSQFDDERHLVPGKGCLDSFPSVHCMEETSKDIGTFATTSRTTTAASIRADEQGVTANSCGETSVYAECERGLRNEISKTEFAAVGGTPDSNPPRYVPHDCAANTRNASEESPDADCSTDETVASTSGKTEDVVFVVREDWEAFTLLYCSQTGIMRAMASALNRVSTQSGPPDLCKRLPTMALGGVGCQQCSSQRGGPCRGWWRSRYVLLRVTVTLVDGAPDATERPRCSTCSCYRCLGLCPPVGDEFTGCHRCSTQRAAQGSAALSPVFQPSAAVGTESIDSVEAHENLFSKRVGVPYDLEATAQPQSDNTKESLQEGESQRLANRLSVDGDPPAISEHIALGTCWSPPQTSLSRSCISQAAYLEARESTPETLVVVPRGADPTDTVDSENYVVTKSHSTPAARGGGADIQNGTAPPLVSPGDERDTVANARGLLWQASPKERTKGSTTPSEYRQSPDAICFKNPPDPVFLSERRSRLASLLSSPCDSFEGFGLGIWSGMSGRAEGVRLGDPDDGSFDSVPLLSTAVFDRLVLTEPAGKSASSPTLVQQEFDDAGTRIRNRSRRVPLADKRRGRGFARSGKTQVLSVNEPGKGARLTLERCYSTCERTIGTEVLAAAQNSFLGMCTEERELAAVFLDFVALVAPGATTTGGTTPTRGRRRRAGVSGPGRESVVAAVSRTGCKRKQNEQLELEPGGARGFCAKTARSEGHDGGVRVEHLAWQSVGRELSDLKRQTPGLPSLQLHRRTAYRTVL